MSIILKSMRAGKVSVNEFNTYSEMLPVLMKIHGMNLPYYILENGKMIFQGNLEFVEKEKDAPVSYTLKTMNEDGMTNTAQFVNFADLSIAAAVADINHMPWFVVDNHSGKIIRQGNIDRVAAIKSGNAPEQCITEEPAHETPDIDTDAALDKMNDALGYDDDCGPSEEELREASLALYTTSSEYRPISRLVYEVSWLTETGHKSQQFEKLEDARSFCETLAYYKLSYLRIDMNGQISGVYLIDRRDAEIPVDTEMLIDEFMKDSLPFSEIPELFRDSELISTWLRPSSPRTGCVKFSVAANLFEVKAYEFTMRQMCVMTNDYVCHMNIWPTIELMANNIAKEIYVVDFYNFNELKPWTDAADKFTEAT